jgi:hypothetical protein
MSFFCDLFAAVRPDVQQLVVALAGGDDAAVVVLLDAVDLLLESSSSACFSSGMRRSVMPKERPASVDCLKPISFMGRAGRSSRRGRSRVAVVDHAGAALLAQGAVVERHALGEDVGEEDAADGRHDAAVVGHLA